MTSRQFSECLAFLDMDMNEPRRSDYYLAQIAAEIRRPNVKDPTGVKTEDFMLKFQVKEDRELSHEEQVEASMRAWGFDPRKAK